MSATTSTPATPTAQLSNVPKTPLIIKYGRLALAMRIREAEQVRSLVVGRLGGT